MHKELEDFYALKDGHQDYLSNRIENAPSAKIRNYLQSLKPLVLNMTDFRITVHQLEYPARKRFLVKKLGKNDVRKVLSQ